VSEDASAGPMPDSPMTEMGQNAAALHEQFMSYVTAGFTRAEALHLISAILTAHIRNTAE
jgi:hypothetical protein